MKQAARLFFLLLFAIGCRQSEPSYRPVKTDQPASQQQSEKNRDIPKNVLDVLSFVRDNGRAPEGHVGGRTFQNREKRLPIKADDGRRVSYREWDVHPKIRGKNRGTDRLITGDDGTAWYTDDHYQTFKKLE